MYLNYGSNCLLIAKNVFHLDKYLNLVGTYSFNDERFKFLANLHT